MENQFQLGHEAAPEPSKDEVVEFEQEALASETQQPEVSSQTPVVQTNAVLSDDPQTLVTQNKDANYLYRLSIPARPLSTFTSLFAQASAANPQELESDDRKDWRRATEEMTGMYTLGELYADRFTDASSEFHQGVMRADGSMIQSRTPKMKEPTGELRGEAALLKITKVLGQGEVLTVPLPHSGINVTIKPPSERSIIDFYNTVFREKIALGRMTAGLTLSNFSVYVNNRLFDFIVDHIHSVNYSDLPKTELRKYLKLPDFYTLATHFVATMYPNGFDFERPCISDDGKCSYVAKGKINLIKLHWVDNKALTEVQKEILSEVRGGKLTLEHYRKYQIEHTRGLSRSFTLGDTGMTIYLRVPTFDEYVSDGYDWINRINSAIDTLIVTDGDETEAKAQMLQQYVKSSNLRQFSHYIERVEVDGSVISDRDTLYKVLEVLSSDDDARPKIFEEVLKYKSDSTIAVIGIPDYKCPSCSTEQNNDPVNDRFVNVIPLDVMNLFFTLLTLRMSRILER